jgi:hypothetical protein
VRVVAALATAAVVAVLALATASPAAAQATASIRLAHFSPDTPQMDVYVVGFDGSETRVLEGLGYGEVSDYAPLEPGDYTFLLRPAGADPESEPAVTAAATLADGANYTFAAMGPNADLQQALLTDDLAAPPAGQAKVRLIQASSTAAEVTVTAADGPTLAQDVPFADTTGYAPVDAGQWTVTATSSTGASVTRLLTLDPGTVNSLVVIEGTNGEPFDVTRVVDGTGVDASGAPTGDQLGMVTAAPLGGVATGAGGTAVIPAGEDGGINPVGIGVAVGVAAALAFGGTQLRRAHAGGPDGPSAALATVAAPAPVARRSAAPTSLATSTAPVGPTQAARASGTAGLAWPAATATPPGGTAATAAPTPSGGWWATPAPAAGAAAPAAEPAPAPPTSAPASADGGGRHFAPSSRSRRRDERTKGRRQA